MGMFGFTNDSRQYDQVCAFRDAAIADGWQHEATYSNESEERASKLTRDGWTMSIISRSRGNYVPDPRWPNHQSPHGKWTYEAQVNIWGPDGLAVNPGGIYDWDKLKLKLRRCPECGNEDVETERVGFANRVCANCAPALRKRIETPGWCD